MPGSEGCHVLRAAAGAYPRRVFPERHVAHIVLAVLDSPVVAYELAEPLRRRLPGRQVGDDGSKGASRCGRAVTSVVLSGTRAWVVGLRSLFLMGLLWCLTATSADECCRGRWFVGFVAVVERLGEGVGGLPLQRKRRAVVCRGSGTGAWSARRAVALGEGITDVLSTRAAAGTAVRFG